MKGYVVREGVFLFVCICICHTHTHSLTHTCIHKHTYTHTHTHTHRAGRISSELAFIMLLSRLAHSQTVKGQMEHKWGYDRTQILRWTNKMLRWMNMNWGHLLDMNTDYINMKARVFSEKLGAFFGYRDPKDCRCLFAIDGCFV